jgi:hypothetical protein
MSFDVKLIACIGYAISMRDYELLCTQKLPIKIVLYNTVHYFIIVS